MTPKELQALFMRGAQAGAQTLVTLLEEGAASGAIKPRDLAVVTGIMVDKVAKLAPLARADDDEPMTPEQRAHEIAENRKIEAELERRGLLKAAGNATSPQTLGHEPSGPAVALKPATAATMAPSAPVVSEPKPLERRSPPLHGNASR